MLPKGLGYFRDEIEERRDLVERLTRDGASGQIIAEILGVTRRTVVRDRRARRG